MQKLLKQVHSENHTMVTVASPNDDFICPLCRKKVLCCDSFVTLQVGYGSTNDGTSLKARVCGTCLDRLYSRLHSLQKRKKVLYVLLSMEAGLKQLRRLKQLLIETAWHTKCSKQSQITPCMERSPILTMRLCGHGGVSLRGELIVAWEEDERSLHQRKLPSAKGL